MISKKEKYEILEKENFLENNNENKENNEKEIIICESTTISRVETNQINNSFLTCIFSALKLSFTNNKFISFISPKKDFIKEYNYFMKEDLEEKKNPFSHLIIFVHGLHGDSKDGAYLKKEFLKKYKDNSIIYHSSICNEGILTTHDGIDKGGNRLADEVQTIVFKYHSSLKKISFIGHSLGGLYARYCIGILYDRQFFEDIIPVNFITMASPHVGSRRSPKGIFNSIANNFTKYALSRTGKQLMLEDNEKDIPLLLQISKKDSSFFKALSLFKYRILYSNVIKDFQVPYPTASILHLNPYKNQFSKIKNNGHIIENPIDHTLLLKEIDYSQLFVNDQKKIFLTEILMNLNLLDWKRIDIYFNSILVHEEIIVKRNWMNSGDDIIQHLIYNFNFQ